MPMQSIVSLNVSLALLNFKQGGKLFDIVDLDPYGSASPFIDTSIACIVDGGIYVHYFLRVTLRNLY